MQRILITGAGRGLGRALVDAALARGDTVVACPRMAGQWPAHPRLRVVPMDIVDPDAIAACHKAVATHLPALDLLINNAGVNTRSPQPELASTARLGELGQAGLLRMLATNAVGPLLVSQAFAPMLARGERPRVVNVSSRRGSLSQKLTGGNYGYAGSKAALNLFTRALAHDLLPQGVVVVAVHPGRIGTAMSRGTPDLSAEEGAVRLLALSDGLDRSHAGRFLRTDGEDHPW